MRVVNDAGSATSQPAVLRVRVPPTINSTLRSLDLTIGDFGRFAISVTTPDDPEVQYQWQVCV